MRRRTRHSRPTAAYLIGIAVLRNSRRVWRPDALLAAQKKGGSVRQRPARDDVVAAGLV